MNKYTTIIYWSSEDSKYIAEVPALPGCVADGYTRTEALLSLDSIIDDWIETAKLLGRSIPEDSAS